METLKIIIDSLEALRTPALLLLVMLLTLIWTRLRQYRHDLNNIGRKINEERMEQNKTRVALSFLAGRINAPEAVQEFLK